MSDDMWRLWFTKLLLLVTLLLAIAAQTRSEGEFFFWNIRRSMADLYTNVIVIQHGARKD